MARVRPGVRRLLWPVTACTALCLLVPRPAFADPATPGGVPDPGPYPVASAPIDPVVASATGTTTIPKDTGPFAADLFAKRSLVETLGERLTKLNEDVAAAQQATTETYQAWQNAADRADKLQKQADDAAANAYKNATELGPLGGYAGDLQQL